MKCPLCDTEMRIIDSKFETVGDNSPDKETKLYRKITFECRNKKCNNDKQYPSKNELPLN